MNRMYVLENYNDIVMDIAEHADRKEMIMLTEDTSEFIEEARKKMPEEVERFLMKLDLHLIRVLRKNPLAMQ